MGTCLVYGTCIGNAVKWFEKRRGLAAGLTAAGFGAGAALTIVPLTRSLSASGYQATFFKFALIQGGVVLVAALALKKPPKGAAVRQLNPRLLQTQVDSRPMQTLRSGLFWVMYAAFVRSSPRITSAVSMRTRIMRFCIRPRVARRSLCRWAV